MFRLARNAYPDAENLCAHCTAKCCRYFALPIDQPTEFNEFENIRWFMFHGSVGIFVDGGQWYLMVIHDCEHLQPDSRCGIYETRPQICRDYSTDKCEFDDDCVYDQYFERPEQIAEYRAVLDPIKRERGFSTAPRVVRPTPLPIIG